ncbi:hypothetical protein L1049_008624 [Liquidambar formosana]|uniref:Aluminum-activated malate transporter 8-like n=1 Tax=Liquidambar formosana TaxID=63359 RepID=A0AAP0X2G3_LIQFO
MEIESATQEKAGLVARWWSGLKALPEKSKAKLVGVAKSIKIIGQDDPRRVVHSLKVGLALTLVSLLYYFRPLYDSFGVSGMWAVLTVVVVFEFTVGKSLMGATLSKSLNRGFATLLAGTLGVGAAHLASLSGEKGKPILLGIFVFLLAAASTFSRFIPRIKARYDYGVVIFILTFSLVSVSDYRADKILEMAHQRLSTIIVGGATCMVISILVCPVWAGEDLHKLVALNNLKVNIFKSPGEGRSTVVISKDDKSFLQAYKSVLNSKTTEANLANFASWEPAHGSFQFRHPWKQYLKIGDFTRQCAYQIEALNCYINSEIQAPQEFQRKIQESCTEMSSESSKALKALSSAIETMTDPSSANPHVENSKKAINDLKIALKATTLERADLLAITQATTVALILIEIVMCMEKIAESVHELSRLAGFKGVEPTATPEKPISLLHRGSVKPVLDGDSAHVVITVHGESMDSLEKTNATSMGKIGKKFGWW